MSDIGFERILVLLLDFLLSGLDDLRRLCDQHAIIRVKTSNPRCVMFVPVLVVCSNHLFDLLPRVRVDLFGICRTGEAESGNHSDDLNGAHNLFLPVMMLI